MQLVRDGAPDDNSGLNNLVLHIIFKAIEDMCSDEFDEESELNKSSAELFFAGFESNSNYALFLEWLGWDVEENGVLDFNRWVDIIESHYTSLSDAKPKLGMSTRLIPNDSQLWQVIRDRREKRPKIGA